MPPGTAWHPPDISIHAPREGSDVEAAFLCGLTDISIHAPREGSDFRAGRNFLQLPISIHAPREGSDLAGEFAFRQDEMISIHAPREGSDPPSPPPPNPMLDFYPRSPRGERLAELTRYQA